jgi:hypothetical protein
VPWHLAGWGAETLGCARRGYINSDLKKRGRGPELCAVRYICGVSLVFDGQGQRLKAGFLALALGDKQRPKTHLG